MARKLDYVSLLRGASVSVVKEILKQIASDGLYKKQHIYVTFSLRHPDVKVSKLLLDEFDDEMTIVLQYEFWDLEVDNYGFSVSLAFEHSDESLYIPFASLISVSDPSEDFCLDFSPDFSSLMPRKEGSPFPKESHNSKVISLDEFRKK